MNDEQVQMEAIAFAGSALAPFFLNDPRTGEAADSFAAMAELDAAVSAFREAYEGLEPDYRAVMSWWDKK